MKEFDYILHAGDTLPPLRYKLCRGTDIVSSDLTGASVRFVLTDGAGVETEMVGSVESNDDKIVRLDWRAGDTDTPGTYSVRVRVTYPDGARETFPAGPARRIRIL